MWKEAWSGIAFTDCAIEDIDVARHFCSETETVVGILQAAETSDPSA